jgi:hypothetical protein
MSTPAVCAMSRLRKEQSLATTGERFKSAKAILRSSALRLTSFGSTALD